MMPWLGTVFAHGQKEGINMDLAIIIFMLVLFFGTMIGIGLFCRKNATDVNAFVLGGRSVGPWLTASLTEPRTFLLWFLLAMPVSSVGNSAYLPLGQVLATPLSVPCWPG